MRYLIILALGLMMFPSYVFADNTPNQLDARLIPNQIMVNTDGVIEVYPKTFGGTIDNLIATSSDSSIVQILSIEKDLIHNVYDVNLEALNSGQVTINMAASGFSSLELPVTINQDSKQATSFLIKATPKVFSNPGPNAGYIAIETVNSDGVPTPVSSDTPIKLSVSDSSVASLANDNVVIKQGSYFATEKFVVNKPGNVQMYASASSMQPVSTSITINNVATPFTLQVYAYPPIVNDNVESTSYVIVQLQDAGGNPVIAKEDIPVSVRIVNPQDTVSVNTSGQSQLVQVNSDLLIKKGSYWGYIPVEYTAGGNTTYNVEIAAKGYTISTIPVSTTITTSTTASSGTTTTTSTTTATGTSTTSTTVSGSVTTKGGSTTASSSTSGSSSTNSICSIPLPVTLSTSQVQIAAVSRNFVLDDKTPCFYPLPILATGNKELIGVLALTDSSGFPSGAKSDLSFRIDSSDTSTVSVPSVEMGNGAQSALVFAQVGNSANPVTLNVVSESPQQITPNIISPSQTTTGLVADPLITNVLPNTPFPLAVYATNNGALGLLKNDFTALVAPEKSISPVQLTVTNGNPVFLADETLLQDGSQNIAITTPDYSSSFTVTGATSKPSSVILGYPDQIISNGHYLFSVELLDSQQLPIKTDHDVDIKLVSSDPSILNVPQSVQIKKDSYYATFDADIKSAGTAEIAVLADEIPLSKFDLTVASFPPTVSIDSVDHVDNNYPLTAIVTATYNQLPLAGMNVSWKVTGAEIKQMDALTDSDGKATISLMVNDPNTVNIEADVSGGPYEPATATKEVSVNPPLSSASTTQSTGQNNPESTFTIFGISPLLFIIPGAGAAAFLVLKKKEMLHGITERFSGIKERMSSQ